MKIEKTNVEDTAKVLNWLIEKVGERLPNSGSNINGIGWCIRCNTYMNTYILANYSYLFSLDQINLAIY